MGRNGGWSGYGGYGVGQHNCFLHDMCSLELAFAAPDLVAMLKAIASFLTIISID